MATHQPGRTHRRANTQQGPATVRCLTPCPLPNYSHPQLDSTVACIKHSGAGAHRATPRSQPQPVPVRLQPVRATLTSLAASQQQQDSGDDTEDAPEGVSRHSNNSGLTEAEKEALDVLEWPSVSSQVARLCETSMGAQRLLRGGLPLGSSYAHSLTLQAQTREAAQLNFRVGDVYDISPALSAVEAGQCLNARQLEGVATALETALKAKETVEAQATGIADGSASKLQYPALAALSVDISLEERTLINAVRHCVRLGGVADDASEALASVRAARRDNGVTLRTLMETTMRTLFERGASDSRSFTIIRDRYCAGIKAGRQSELPKGSVKVGSSQTGATMYYEPAPAIPLNNQAALLASQEKEEENKVLILLSTMLASRSEAIRKLLEAVTQLDMVAARARHARLFHAVPPTIILPPAHHDSPPPNGSHSRTETDTASGVTSLMHVCHAHHPLLLERAMETPLPDPVSGEENTFERDFAPPAAWERLPRGAAASAAAAARMPPPRALDLSVPSGRRVVAITGPNTGGKTVTLKTMGLMALMARAGMWLPVDAHTQGVGVSDTVAVGTNRQPVVGWFERVLADIGDAQSLQQSLSTFSGHIRRIRQILSTVTPGSLVLLDEVGSGTDPLEGAALARAVLDRLAGRAALTVATTHHAELKHVATEDSRYCNVSMEFDTVSLRPTYKLLWGSVGASNALDIARTLGFDSAVVSDAVVVARTTFEAQADLAARLAATATALRNQVEDSRSEVTEARQKRLQLERQLADVQAQIADMQQTKAALEASPRRIVARRDRLRAAVDAAVSAYEQGKGTRADVDKALEELASQVPHLVARHLNPDTQAGNELSTTQAGSGIAVGDRVVVPSRFGEDTLFTVASVSGGVATLAPEGAVGVALQLLSMGTSGNRQRRGSKASSSSIRVPVSECRVVMYADTA